VINEVRMIAGLLRQGGPRLDRACEVWISTGIVAGEGQSSSLMVRDPDGHAMLINENARN
jgi:hypothetical protein